MKALLNLIKKNPVVSICSLERRGFCVKVPVDWDGQILTSYASNKTPVFKDIVCAPKENGNAPSDKLGARLNPQVFYVCHPQFVVVIYVSESHGRSSLSFAGPSKAMV